MEEKGEEKEGDEEEEEKEEEEEEELEAEEVEKEEVEENEEEAEEEKEAKEKKWRRSRRRRKRTRRRSGEGVGAGGRGGERGAGGGIPPKYLINFVRKASKICSKRRQSFFLFALLFLGYCSNKGMDLHLHPSKCISLCPNSVLVWDFDSEAMRLNICKS